MEGFADLVDAKAADLLPARGELARLSGTTDEKAVGIIRMLLARCQVDATFDEQLVAIEHLGRYIVAGPRLANSDDSPALARLHLLVTMLENVPAAAVRVRAALAAVFAGTRGVKLFGEIGLPNERGLLAETTDRLARRFLPEAPAKHELWVLANKIIRKPGDLEWLGPGADPLLARLAVVGGDAWTGLRSSLLDAIGVITTRIASLGIAEAFRSRTTAGGIRDVPLYALGRAEPRQMPALIEACRHHLELVKVSLEDHGVSIDVVYSLDSIERGLARLELLLPFVGAAPRPAYAIRAVSAAVGRGLVSGRSFTQLMSDNLRLLARKVIERAGRTGEHYVTSSRREYWKMMTSAMGGGVLTCGTACAKFLVKWGHWPLFVDGALSSVVYAGSFLVMQLLGFTLATKQPSMTAAALAGTIRGAAGEEHRLDELVGLIARIARSQFAAAFGNVAAVIVTARLFDFLYQRSLGHPFLDADTARATIASFDPLGSGTILFAAFTGVLLWTSSLVAGWFENWVVYRRLPEAIEHHRFGKRFGKPRMTRLARWLEHEAAGFGGSIALGVLLGMAPVFAKFFGLPLDVRHITLSTGSLTLSLSSVGTAAVGWGAVLSAAFGIVVIGMLNFGVSFALALVVALRARDVPRGERRRLPGAVLRHFLRRPFEFFYPPREASAPPPP